MEFRETLAALRVQALSFSLRALSLPNGATEAGDHFGTRAVILRLILLDAEVFLPVPPLPFICSKNELQLLSIIGSTRTRDMRVASMLFAAIYAVSVLAASMATAEDTGDMRAASEPKEVVADKTSEGAHEAPKHESRARKPRIGNMFVRQTWDECVGMEVTKAIDLIKAARPDLKSVVKVKEGSMVTMDIRMNRVRVYCDDNDIVTRPPRVG